MLRLAGALIAIGAPLSGILLSQTCGPSAPVPQPVHLLRITPHPDHAASGSRRMLKVHPARTGGIRSLVSLRRDLPTGPIHWFFIAST